jgi:hypothetical protein
MNLEQFNLRALKVEKLITKIISSLFTSVFENQIKNFQYPKTNSSFTLSGSGPSALSNNDQCFPDVHINSISSVLFTAPINTVNSNFQQSPLIVPCFYKMALNNRKSGINNLTIGNQTFSCGCAIIERCCPKRVKTQRNNLPIQQILNNKVKLVLMIIQNKLGILKYLIKMIN